MDGTVLYCNSNCSTGDLDPALVKEKIPKFGNLESPRPPFSNGHDASDQQKSKTQLVEWEHHFVRGQGFSTPHPSTILRILRILHHPRKNTQYCVRSYLLLPLCTANSPFPTRCARSPLRFIHLAAAHKLPCKGSS
jgi:hypothetical protein